MRIFPITGSPFQVETVASANGVTELHLTARDSYNFSAAGVIATVNQIYTYLNTTANGAKNAATLMRLAPNAAGLAVHVDVSAASYPVLTGDVAAQVSALTTIVQTAANVTT